MTKGGQDVKSPLLLYALPSKQVRRIKIGIEVIALTQRCVFRSGILRNSWELIGETKRLLKL